ncbi:KRAB and SCAN domains-containing zinc finger protein, partial [Clonorchis sinensis]
MWLKAPKFVDTASGYSHATVVTQVQHAHIKHHIAYHITIPMQHLPKAVYPISILYIHMRSHLAVKRYHCVACGRENEHGFKFERGCFAFDRNVAPGDPDTVPDSASTKNTRKRVSNRFRWQEHGLLCLLDCNRKNSNENSERTLDCTTTRILTHNSCRTRIDLHKSTHWLRLEHARISTAQQRANAFSSSRIEAERKQTQPRRFSLTWIRSLLGIVSRNVERTTSTGTFRNDISTDTTQQNSQVAPGWLSWTESHSYSGDGSNSGRYSGLTETIETQRCPAERGKRIEQPLPVREMYDSHSHPTYEAACRLRSCPACGNSFTHFFGLMIHMLKHRKTKDALCELCGFQFSCTKNLQLHMYKTHASNIVMPPKSQLQCSICRKSFIFKSILEIHMRSHSAAKPYKCATCGKTYKHAFNLKRHNTIQRAKETPLQCPHTTELGRHCDAQCRQQDLFCIFCKKSYSNKFCLKRHQLMIH